MKKCKNELQEEEDIGSDLGSDDEDETAPRVVSKGPGGAKKRARALGDKGRPKSAKLIKQPTTEELNRLRETENLFNSNFFRLQIDEILKEVTVKPKYISQFNKWLLNFNTFLSELKSEDNNYSITDRSWLDGCGLVYPITEEPLKSKGYFKFVKCAPPRVVGSYSYGGCLGPSLSVHLKIDLPNELIHSNDYLNERYHRKKALYLCHIAKQLQNSDLIENIQFKSLNECNLKPVLVFQPAGKIGKHVKITLHVGVPEGTMKCMRFHPAKNNIRENWRCDKDDADSEASLTIATPRYNATLLSDLVADPNHEFLLRHLNNSSNIQQGVLLLKVWLRQRNLSQFSNYIMAMFVVHLVKLKRINNAMSSYQVIRNVWTALGSSEWDTKGISLLNEEERTSSHPSLFELHNYYPVVFADCTGYYNICSYLSLDVYTAVKQESLLAVNYLDGLCSNGFSALFMMRVDFNMKYDHILRIENTSHLRHKILQSIDNNEKVDHGPDTRHLIETHVMNIIRKGLGDRIAMVTPKCLSDDDLTWDCGTERNFHVPFVIGIKLNPETAFRVMDKGPEANVPEAEEFRKFWGTKSELRRFQDGSISEACVWQAPPTAEGRRLIVKQIIYYLLHAKLGITDDLFYIADQFEYILHNQKFQPADFEYGTGEEAMSRVSSAFDGLMKNLRSLTDTPLDINSIHGVSSVFSFTDVSPPLPYAPVSIAGFTSCESYRLIRDEVKQERRKKSERVEVVAPLYVPSLRVLVQLSQSGKWPDNLEAFRKIKSAFYIQIAEAIKDQYSLTVHPWHNHVDIMKDGYIFRLEISHGKEINLMKKVVDKDGVSKSVDTEESLQLEYRLVHLPRLRIALNGLHHTYPSYGPATCLLKRWLHCHLINESHFPDECIDLLMAHLFVHPAPYQAASQPQTSFWRALSLLATADWTTHMVIVNFNDDISREQLTEAESNFNSNRSSLPPLYFLTPYESRKPSLWSRHAPSYQILARLQVLAKEALNFVDQIVFKQLSSNVKSLFTPNLEGYDVLIYLEPLMNPLHHLQIKSELRSKVQSRKCKPYEKLDNEIFPVLDFDPVDIYLKKLRSSYDEFALFFHDSYGGDVIGVLWKPSAMDLKDFKTSLLNGRKTITRNGKPGLVADLDSILDGCLILGDGLVTNIEVKNN